MNYTFLGVLLQTFAMLIVALGNLLQKVALRKCVKNNTSFAKSPTWWIALTFIIIA